MAHRQVLKKAAEKSVILLKNDSKLLPLGNTYHKKIAVIGCNADRIHSDGGGSAEIMGETGILVPIQNSEALAKGLEQAIIVTHDESIKKMGNRIIELKTFNEKDKS